MHHVLRMKQILLRLLLLLWNNLISNILGLILGILSDYFGHDTGRANKYFFFIGVYLTELHLV